MIAFAFFGVDSSGEVHYLNCSLVSGFTIGSILVDAQEIKQNVLAVFKIPGRNASVEEANQKPMGNLELFTPICDSHHRRRIFDLIARFPFQERASNHLTILLLLYFFFNYRDAPMVKTKLRLRFA